VNPSAQISLAREFKQGVLEIEYDLDPDPWNEPDVFSTVSDLLSGLEEDRSWEISGSDGLWLWLRLLLAQKELDVFCEAERAQLAQDRYRAQRYPLESVDTALVSQLIEDIGGEGLLRHPPPQYDHAVRDILVQRVLPMLKQVEVTWQNAKQVFEAMLPFAEKLHELE